MSLLAHFSDAAGQTWEAGVVAEAAAAFGRWVDGLPAAGHEALKGLREGGFAYDLAALEGQLRRALARPGAPAAGLKLLRILARRGDAVCLLVEEAAVPAAAVAAGAP
jgi:hypothetical protein